MGTMARSCEVIRVMEHSQTGCGLLGVQPGNGTSGFGTGGAGGPCSEVRKEIQSSMLQRRVPAPGGRARGRHQPTRLKNPVFARFLGDASGAFPWWF